MGSMTNKKGVGGEESKSNCNGGSGSSGGANRETEAFFEDEGDPIWAVPGAHPQRIRMEQERELDLRRFWSRRWALWDGGDRERIRLWIVGCFVESSSFSITVGYMGSVIGELY